MEGRRVPSYDGVDGWLDWLLSYLRCNNIATDAGRPFRKATSCSALLAIVTGSQMYTSFFLPL
jgi:hypothetical protein